jgi:hypothetical protein
MISEKPQMQIEEDATMKATNVVSITNEAEQEEEKQDQAALKLVHDFIERFEEETGRWHGSYFRMIIAGDYMEEVGDIKHMAVQALMNFSADTDEPFNECVSEFLESFKAEIEGLREQGYPESGRSCYASVAQ